jgi:hypothetical protein
MKGFKKQLVTERGLGLDLIGNQFKLERFEGETDLDFRRRIWEASEETSLSIDKQVELALENLDMMSERDALEWIAQQDEEFIDLIAQKIWEGVRNQETVQVPKGISEDEFLEWLVEDFHIETATGESLDEFAKYTPVWKLPDESCEDYRKKVLDLMNRQK